MCGVCVCVCVRLRRKSASESRQVMGEEIQLLARVSRIEVSKSSTDLFCFVKTKSHTLCTVNISFGVIASCRSKSAIVAML